MGNFSIILDALLSERETKVKMINKIAMATTAIVVSSTFSSFEKNKIRKVKTRIILTYIKDLFKLFCDRFSGIIALSEDVLKAIG